MKRKSILSTIFFAFIFLLPILVSSLGAKGEPNCVTVELSSANPKQVVALVPTEDRTSVTVDSENPANLSIRSFNNRIMTEKSILESNTALYEYPWDTINKYDFMTNPPSNPHAYSLNDADTNFLVINSVFSDSYGSFNVSTNKQDFLINDNEEKTVNVNPHATIHLKIKVSHKGPIILKVQSIDDELLFYQRFPDLISPDGEDIQILYYYYMDDVYFFFIAEKSGYYDFIFDPKHDYHYISFKTEYFEPEKITVTSEKELITSGKSDSELTVQDIEDAKITFEWYIIDNKLQKPSALQVHRVTQRQSTLINNKFFFFTPTVNRSYLAEPLPSNYTISNFDKSDYVLAITDGTSRYILGFNEIPKVDLTFPDEKTGKLGSVELTAYSFEVTELGVYEFNISTKGPYAYEPDLNIVHFPEVMGSPVIFKINESVIQIPVFSTQRYKNEGLIYHRFFLDPGDYIVLIKNSGVSQGAYQLKTRFFTSFESMSYTSLNNKVDHDNYNVSSSGTHYSLNSNGKGLSDPLIIKTSSTVEDARYKTSITLGYNWYKNPAYAMNDPNERINFYLRFRVYTYYQGHLRQSEYSGTYLPFITNSSIISSTEWSLSFPYTAYGDYYYVLDSYSYKSTGYEPLPYKHEVDVAFLDISSDFKKVENIAFTDNTASVILPNINKTEYSGYIIKVPVEKYQWTDITVHTINFSIDSGINSGIASSMSYIFDDPLKLQRRRIFWDIEEDPIVGQIGNYTSGFGSVTNDSYVYLYLWSTDQELFYEGEIIFERIPTTLLPLFQESNLKFGSSVNGFEFLLVICGLIEIAFYFNGRRNSK